MLHLVQVCDVFYGAEMIGSVGPDDDHVGTCRAHVLEFYEHMFVCTKACGSAAVGCLG